MQVYDAANRLAREIKNSKEYIAYKKLKDDIYQNSEKKQKVEEFEKLRYDVQLITYTRPRERWRKKKKIRGNVFYFNKK